MYDSDAQHRLEQDVRDYLAEDGRDYTVYGWPCADAQMDQNGPSNTNSGSSQVFLPFPAGEFILISIWLYTVVMAVVLVASALAGDFRSACLFVAALTACLVLYVGFLFRRAGSDANGPDEARVNPR